ncbi:hypothetical protein PM082_006382 [Marasmius tenuissimus]|nr:hypothetical protein PM082_006382 [Marasmius tenuissimus]
MQGDILRTYRKFGSPFSTQRQKQTVVFYASAPDSLAGDTDWNVLFLKIGNCGIGGLTGKAAGVELRYGR